MQSIGYAKTRSRGERGQDLVEFALIFPILFLVLMGIFDLGRAVYFSSALHNAAREGARYASVAPTDTPGIEAVVQNIAMGIAPSDLDITITIVPGVAYDVVEVAVEYDMPILTPLIGTFFGGDNEVPLSSKTSMKVEAS